MAQADEPLRFALLGPLQVWQGDRELYLGPAKQRGVLATLLLNGNRPIPASRIVDAVWEDSPPRNGANVVQKYVAGLRRVLEPERSPRAPGEILALTDAGYVLRVPPGGLDTDNFDALVRDARRARTDGRLDDAAALLRDADRLHRGEPLAGLTGPVFGAARDRLSERRVAALEERAEIELELGGHAALAPELGRLVDEFPLREGLRHLLMLALYRSGRQAEALAAFREARRFLVDEYGVEPGERLQQLQRRILSADPTLGSSEPPVTAPASPAAAPAPPNPAAPFSSVPPASSEPPASWTSWLWRMAAAMIPLVSCGVLTWVVMIFYAGRRRSWWLALAAVGYLGLIAGFFLAIPPEETAEMSGRDVAAIVMWFLAIFGGAAHAALIDPRWTRTDASPRHPQGL